MKEKVLQVFRMGALLTGALVHANEIWGITVTRLRGFLGKMWLALHSIARFGGGSSYVI